MVHIALLKLPMFFIVGQPWQNLGMGCEKAALYLSYNDDKFQPT